MRAGLASVGADCPSLITDIFDSYQLVPCLSLRGPRSGRPSNGWFSNLEASSEKEKDSRTLGSAKGWEMREHWNLCLTRVDLSYARGAVSGSASPSPTPWSPWTVCAASSISSAAALGWAIIGSSSSLAWCSSEIFNTGS